MIKERISGLREYIAEEGLTAVIVSKQENIHYFSGFRGDSTLLYITAGEQFLLTDSRYTEQAAEQAPSFVVLEQKEGLFRRLNELIKAESLHGSVGFEGGSLTFNEYQQIAADQLEKLQTVSLDKLRVIKEAEEIGYIKKAAEIADKAFDDIVKYIKPGMSENEVAFRLETVMRSLGSERPAFTTIVASGKRGSLPHGIATEKLIVAGEFVTMDYGAVFKGYHSDMTRTIAVGQVDEEHKRIYDAVLQAQLIGVDNVKPGVSGRSVDEKVRAYLQKHGIEQYFTHGLGHSLGLEIHEEPRLSRLSTCEALKPGMLVTVEPGVYIPGRLGLRIEDTVLVTEVGHEILTRSSKQFIEI